MSLHNTPHDIGHAAGGRDPRDIITPDAFHVAPALLGRPLATPWRRAAALLIDLGLVFLLTEAGGIFFGLVAGVAFFCIAVRKPVDHWLKRWVRGAFALLGAGVLFLTVFALIFLRSVDDSGMPSLGQWGQLGMAYGEQDPEKRAALLEDTLTELEAAGVPATDLDEIIDTYGLPPDIAAGLRVTVRDDESPPSPERPSPDLTAVATALEAYVAALRAGDEAAVEAQAPAVRQLVAGDEIARLEERQARAQTAYRALLDEKQALADKAANPGLRRVFETVAGELGLTIGWSGVYFTLFLAWWSGRTPGKRLLRLRVVRLDDRPLSLWAAFERFAGYAAGLASGFLGFLQILWDPNRQGLQDKIVGTVVIVEP